MAEGKKSFVAYSDWKNIFDELPNEDAGILIKHIFAYVNDENPKSDSVLINAVFANIKSTLKRDLIKWEGQVNQRREAGKKSAQIRATKSNERSTLVDARQRNSTDSVNVSVSVNVSDNVNEVFSKRLLESEIDLEAIEISTRIKVTKEITEQFIAHLTTEGKEHLHYNEWKKHLRNWITKRPEIKSTTKILNQEPPKYKKL